MKDLIQQIIAADQAAAKRLEDAKQPKAAVIIDRWSEKEGASRRFRRIDEKGTGNDGCGPIRKSRSGGRGNRPKRRQRAGRVCKKSMIATMRMGDLHRAKRFAPSIQSGKQVIRLLQKNSPAVLSKARAMYGKRITPAQFDEMLRCPSVVEVAAYLKGHTHYQKVLSGISENDIHRGQLEELLRRAFLEECDKLFYYQGQLAGTQFDFFLQETEIQELMRMVLLIRAGKTEHFIVELPQHLMQHRKSGFSGIFSGENLPSTGKTSPRRAHLLRKRAGKICHGRTITGWILWPSNMRCGKTFTNG